MSHAGTSEYPDSNGEVDVIADGQLGGPGADYREGVDPNVRSEADVPGPQYQDRVFDPNVLSERREAGRVQLLVSEPHRIPSGCWKLVPEC